jgi:hypothetical protein
MSRKYSFYAGEYLKAAFEPVLARPAEYKITDNMVAITFEGKDKFACFIHTK